MRTLGLRLAAVGIAWMACAAPAQTVTAPPRPPGFALVRPVAGIPPKEMHDFGEKEHRYARPDATHDDSIPVAGPAAGTAAAAAAATDSGGKGTGPARETGGKGASSYFYERRK